jgi:hypothetical protein
MTNFTELPFAPPNHLVPFTGQLRLAVAACLARFKGSPGTTPSPACAATWAGALGAAWTCWLRGARTWSCTSGGCRRSAGSSPPPSPGACR